MDSGRIIQTFLDLISIYSPSLQEDFVFEYVFKKLRPLGYNVEIQVNGNIKNMIIFIPGNIKGKEKLFFCAHADTVETSKDIKIIVDEEKGVIKSDGKTILGSDDKAGITAMLELAYHLKEDPTAEYGDIYLVITSGEEIGLVGAKNLDLSNIEVSYGYCLDSHGNIGKAILKGTTYYRFKIECLGKASHAGVEPERGINSIKMAGAIISEIPAGLINENTVVNIGKIHGGKATNIVPDCTVMEGELRSFDSTDINYLISSIESICEQTEKFFNSPIKFLYEKLYDGFEINPDSASVKKFVRSCSIVGISPFFETTRGGSDANILNSKGIETLNISCGMRNPHSTEEFIYISDLLDISKLVITLAVT